MAPPPLCRLGRAVTLAAVVAGMPGTVVGTYTATPEVAGKRSEERAPAQALMVERRVVDDVPAGLYRKGVPRREKKALFVRTLLPLILLENERIEHRRSRLLALKEALARGRLPGAKDVAWLRELAADYRLKGDPVEEPKTRRELARRVDVIPPALALAQAALETGWGSSGAARHERDLFGMVAVVSKRSRAARKTRHPRGKRQARFVSLQDSVHSYIHNLNTHSAYQRLRLLRAKAQASNQSPAGAALADGLTRYSELGQHYVRTVQSIIHQSHLARYDTAALRPEANDSVASLAGISLSRADALPVLP